MPGEEIDRSLLWRKAREDKQGNIPDPKATEKAKLIFASMVEIGVTIISVYMRYLFDFLKLANMVNLVGLVDLAQVSTQCGPLSQRSRHLANHLKKENGDQILLVPYNLGQTISQNSHLEYSTRHSKATIQCRAWLLRDAFYDGYNQ
ncbi:unnamed protein product [Prunus armeniaca]